MMKKLLLLGVALFSFSLGIKAQAMAIADTVIIDTLHYYFNKHYFKTGEKVYNKYPYYKSAASTVTNVTHCGSRFNNHDSLYITGLEAFASKAPVTVNLAIPIHLYLCSLDVNNKPILPAIDSVTAVVNNTNVSIVGGNFKNAQGQPVRHGLKKDFAVLFRNMSTVAGDTVFLLRTAGATYTNMVAQPYQRSSDIDYGYVRYLAKFYSTRDFTVSGFGVGTDYEFIVAPRVTYTLHTAHQIPQEILDVNSGAKQDTTCTRTLFTFTNTSSFHYTNRFYNLMAFYQKWNLYSAFVANPASGNWDADSAITWNFEFKELFSPNGDGRVFLPYSKYGVNETIQIAADRPSPNSDDISGCFDANQFRARMRPMSPFGRVRMVKYNIPFKICMKYCNDAIGLAEHEAFSMLQVFPNPLVNGITEITGLKGTNLVRVYDILGQVVVSKTVSETETEIDLSSFAAGTYLIRVFNEESASKAIRVVKQ